MRRLVFAALLTLATIDSTGASAHHLGIAASGEFLLVQAGPGPGPGPQPTPIGAGAGLVFTGNNLGIATGGVTNGMLANPSLTLGSTVLTLGTTTTSVSGLSLAGTYTLGGTPAITGLVSVNGWSINWDGSANHPITAGPSAGLNINASSVFTTGLGDHACGSNGNAIDGMGGGTGMTGAENNCFGFGSLTQVTTGSFLNGYGTESLGHEIDGTNSDCFGTDCAKWTIHGNKNAGFGTNNQKFLWNQNQVSTFGSQAMAGRGLQPTISGAVAASGLVRLTLSATTGMTTNDSVFVNNVGGVSAANGQWYINVVDGTHIDLQGSTFSGAYTSGGNIIDLTSGQINQAVSAAVNNGSGKIRLTIGPTLNIVTGNTVHVAGVTGTTEANGDWTITVVDNLCQSACRIDLNSSTFTNAYISGGQATFLNGPLNVMAGGYNVLSSASLTGNIKGVLAWGTNVAPSATGLGAVTVLGDNVAPTILGSTGANINLFLGGYDSTTDVSDGTVNSAVGIGGSMKLTTNSVQIGKSAGGSARTGHNGGVTALGNLACSNATTAFGFLCAGGSVGPTLTTGSSDILFGVGSSTADVTNNNDVNAIVIATGSNGNALSGGSHTINVENIIKCSGTGTAATAPCSFSGTLLASSHLLATSSAPSISSCGTGSPTVSGSDNFGTVVAGTVATTCVVNFGTSWGTAPRCVAASGTAIASLTVSASQTQLTITGTALGGDTINWVCGSTASLELPKVPANDNVQMGERMAA